MNLLLFFSNIFLTKKCHFKKLYIQFELKHDSAITTIHYNGDTLKNSVKLAHYITLNSHLQSAIADCNAFASHCIAFDFIFRFVSANSAERFIMNFFKFKPMKMKQHFNLQKLKWKYNVYMKPWIMNMNFLVILFFKFT